MARHKSTQDPDTVLARVTPKGPRRVVAVGMLTVLGALVLSVAITRPPEIFGFLVFLVLFGGGSLWMGWAMWRATARELELTATALRETGAGGRVLCEIDNIARVDRGMFTFKPAGGFLVRLRSAPGRAIAPGLWWRFGRTLAVGGVTARAQGKEVADLMTLLVLEREGAGPS